MARNQRAAPKAAKQSKTDSAPEAALPESLADISDEETKVLKLFRKYLMTPGQMLCLSPPDVATMGSALESMVSRGMLVPESFKGGYSLTRVGFDAMHDLSEKSS